MQTSLHGLTNQQPDSHEICILDDDDNNKLQQLLEEEQKEIALIFKS